MLNASFDDILTNRVGFGRSQIEQFIVLSLIDFIDGVAEILMVLLIAILSNEWSLTHGQAKVFSTVYFVGIVVGSFASSFFADRIGRKNLMIGSMFATFVCLLITGIVNNYVEMIICRVCLGVLFGLSMPMSYVVISEIVPMHLRGRFIVLLQFMVWLGIFYILCFSMLFLDSFDSGNWRGLVLVNSIPAFICFIGSVFILRESPRFYLSQKKFNEGCIEIDLMLKKNHGDNCKPLDEDEKFQIQKWHAETDISLNQKDRDVSLAELFNEKNRKITLFIMTLYFFQNLQGVGLFVVIPLLFAQNNESFTSLIIPYAAEIPALILGVILIDKKSFGRRKVTIIGYIFQASAEILLFLIGTSGIVACVVCIKIGSRGVNCGLRTFPAESYPTRLRSKACGFIEGWGKILGSISPFIMLSLYYEDQLLPFLFAAIMCGCAIITLIFFPKEMTLVPLDENEITKNTSSVTPTQTDNQVSQTVELQATSHTTGFQVTERIDISISEEENENDKQD